MKGFLRQRFINILRFLAVTTIKKFQPEIIGVTGSVGKTSAKEAIYAVLRSNWRVRANYGNFNTEIGLPLTVLGPWQKIGGASFWLPVLAFSFVRLLIPRLVVRDWFGGYPEILVLEYAADRPGDIKYLVDLANPNISVVTALGEIPVHVGFYQDVEAVRKEKEYLVSGTKKNGLVILNADDKSVMKMKESTNAKVMTFGKSPHADVRLSDLEVKMENNKPSGISFKLHHKEKFASISISWTVGSAQAYAACAATCIGLYKNLSLNQIAKFLNYYKPLKRRTSIKVTKKGAVLIDDSYNSSPLALSHAVEAASQIKAKRKIAVLGDMRELGHFSGRAHKKAGKEVAEVFDYVITIGTESRVLARAAEESGVKKDNIFQFNSSEESIKTVKDLVKKGDLVLVKASLAIGASKIVKALMD